MIRYIRHYTLPWSFRSCTFFSLAAISSASFSACRALFRIVSTVDSDEHSCLSRSALSRRLSYLRGSCP
jgi:hypothetical protein